MVREGQIVYNPYVIWEGAVHALSKLKAGVVSPVYPVWETREPDGGFVDFLLRTPPLIEAYNRLCSGAVNRRRSIREDAFAGIEVQVPPISERREIATALHTVQQAREFTKRVISATREFKNSLLRHLFTYGPVPVDQADKVTLKATEIGMMPAEWDIRPLGDSAAIGNGSTPKRTEPRYWEKGTIPWLTSAKVHEGIIHEADEFVTGAACKECHLPLVPKGSLVVAITGQGRTLGNVASLAIDACVSQHLAYVSFHGARLLPGFVLAYLRSCYDQLQAVSRAGGSTKGALTCGFLKRFVVPCPSLPEQHQIVAQVSSVESKLLAEEKRLAALNNLFHSLLHHLMTGKVRVPSALASVSDKA